MIYLAAMLIVAAVALFVAAPLTGGLRGKRRASNEISELDRLEHERELAVQGLRELEFDHEMGKLGETDYQDLHATLERRALSAMSAIDRVRLAAEPVSVRTTRPEGKKVAPISAAAFCPDCGARAARAHQFCGQCGAALNLSVRAAR